MNFADIWNRSQDDNYLCSSNGYCQIVLTFWAIWRQNCNNFILGHTVWLGTCVDYFVWKFEWKRFRRKKFWKLRIQIQHCQKPTTTTKKKKKTNQQQQKKKKKKKKSAIQTSHRGRFNNYLSGILVVLISNGSPIQMYFN